jgi:hypothetical protein
MKRLLNAMETKIKYAVIMKTNIRIVRVFVIATSIAVLIRITTLPWQ